MHNSTCITIDRSITYHFCRIVRHTSIATVDKVASQSDGTTKSWVWTYSLHTIQAKKEPTGHSCCVQLGVQGLSVVNILDPFCLRWILDGHVFSSPPSHSLEHLVLILSVSNQTNSTPLTLVGLFSFFLFLFVKSLRESKRFQAIDIIISLMRPRVHGCYR